MPFRKTQKRKRRKRGQRGGVLYKISPAVLQRLHKPIGVHAKDCCPCVFKLLGMSEADAQRLATRMPAGFSKDAIVDYFSTMYPKYSFSFQEVNAVTAAAEAEVLHKIFSKIPPAFGILGGYQRADGSKHCIAFARRTVDGRPVIYDAQAGQLIQGLPTIIAYMNFHQIITIWLLRSVTRGVRSTAKMSLILPKGAGGEAVAKAQLAATLTSGHHHGMKPEAILQRRIDTALAGHHKRVGETNVYFARAAAAAAAGGGGGAAALRFRDAAHAAHAARKHHQAALARTHGEYTPALAKPIKLVRTSDKGADTATRLRTFRDYVANPSVAHPELGHLTPADIESRMAMTAAHPGIHAPTIIHTSAPPPPAATGKWHPGSGTYIGKRKQEKKRRAAKSLRVNLLQKMRRKTRKKRGMGKKRRRKRRRTKKYRK